MLTKWPLRTRLNIKEVLKLGCCANVRGGMMGSNQWSHVVQVVNYLTWNNVHVVGHFRRNISDANLNI